MGQANQISLPTGSTVARLDQYLDNIVNRPMAFNGAGIAIGAGDGHFLIDSTLQAGVIGIEPAVLATPSDVPNGSIVAAELAGNIGTPATTRWQDADGKIANMIEIVDAGSGGQMLDANSRVIHGLVQTSNGVAQGTAIGGTGAENLQVSFVVLVAGVVTLTTMPGAETITFALRQNTIDRNRPTYQVDPSKAGAAAGAGSGFNLMLFECTTAYTPNETIDILTGDGATAGRATRIVRGTPFQLPASSAAFVADNSINVHLGGIKAIPVLDSTADYVAETTIQWLSATTFRLNRAWQPGTVFAIEQPV